MPDTLILIVDDDRTIVRLCQRLLERASYRVMTATDPLDALKILERVRVDLLLSDIRMPVMDGFELISQAKKLQPELPVLVMTGYASIDNAIQALHRGVEGLILKPFENSAELVSSVQRVLEENYQRRDAARLQALRPLFDVTERLLAETSPQPLEKLIINTLTGLFLANFAGIYRLNAQAAGFEVLRTTTPGQSAVEFVLQQQVLSLTVAEGAPSLHKASGPGGSQAVQAALREIGWDTCLTASVNRNGTQFVFCAARSQGSTPFTEADLEMLVILARQAAVALENARLYSDLKDYVHRVEESQRALIQAEKMAAVGRLMASLAHEINNPLQAVRNCLHLAARKGLESEQRLQYLEMTDAELERLVTTVRRMLDFYRPGSVEKQRVDLHLMIDQVLALLCSQMREQDIQVHLNYVGHNMPVYMVPDQMQQVIFNLVINAMDALEEVPRKLVTASSTGSYGPSGGSKEVWIDVYHDERQVRLLVEDSGPGIPCDLGERIFEPFVSSKPHGTGLGLAVSYGIIERHQGTLSLISPQHGAGACFEVALPLTNEGDNGKNINC